MKAEATARPGTPLAEFAVGALVFLIFALFQTADKAVGRDLEAHPVFIDKLLLDLSHLIYITSLHWIRQQSFCKNIRVD